MSILTDDEYQTLLNESLKGFTETTPEEVLPTLQPQELWFDEYIKPLPTWSWFDPKEYGHARTLLIRRPPAPNLIEKASQLAGVIEGDGSFGYVREPEYIYSFASVSMRPRDKQVIDEIGRLWGLRAYPDKYSGMWKAYTKGLRAYMVTNITRPYYWATRRKEGAKFVVETGYRATTKDLWKFRELYRPRMETAIVEVAGSTEQEMEVELWYIEPTSQE